MAKYIIYGKTLHSLRWQPKTNECVSATDSVKMRLRILTSCKNRVKTSYKQEEGAKGGRDKETKRRRDKERKRGRASGPFFWNINVHEFDSLKNHQFFWNTKRAKCSSLCWGAYSKTCAMMHTKRKTAEKYKKDTRASRAYSPFTPIRFSRVHAFPSNPT